MVRETLLFCDKPTYGRGREMSTHRLKAICIDSSGLGALSVPCEILKDIELVVIREHEGAKKTGSRKIVYAILKKTHIQSAMKGPL